MAESNNLELKNGKELNMMGVNINIAEILGDKIAKEWIANIDEDKIKKIIDFLTSEYFTVEKYTGEIKVKAATNSWDNTKYPIDQVKTYFALATKDLLTEKVKEIINSTSYKEEINNIAEELVEYAIEGYKEDLKTELRTRLVDNVLSPDVSFGKVSLNAMINSIIDSRLRM